MLTFGDPVLDMITNRHGITVIKGEVYNVFDRVLREGGPRGGVRSRDLGPYLDDIRRMQLARAVLDRRDFALLEKSLLTLAEETRR